MTGADRVVGIIGLGNMGAPMARACLRAGFAVAGFDVDEAAVVRLAADGGTGVEDAAALPRLADIVILMLPNSAIVESVVEGLLESEALRPGHLIIDMSSSEPTRTRALAARLSDLEVALVDAPVSGGVRRAVLGSLTVMAGGDPADIARAGPVLAAMGTVVEVGAVGSGHAVKALNNLLSGTHLLATAEVMLAGERFGLDPEAMLSVFNTSSGRSGSTEVKWPDFVLTDRFDSGFALGLLLKDMRIAIDLLRAVEGPDELSASAVQSWARAAEELPPGADHTEIARWVRAVAGG